MSSVEYIFSSIYVFFLSVSQITFDLEPLASALRLSRLDLWKWAVLWVEEYARHLHKGVPLLPLLVSIDTKRWLNQGPESTDKFSTDSRTAHLWYLLALGKVTCYAKRAEIESEQRSIQIGWLWTPTLIFRSSLTWMWFSYLIAFIDGGWRPSSNVVLRARTVVSPGKRSLELSPTIPVLVIV